MQQRADIVLIKAHFKSGSMSEELTRKKKVRGRYRASAKQILGEVQTSISNEPTDIARIAKLQQSIADSRSTG